MLIGLSAASNGVTCITAAHAQAENQLILGVRVSCCEQMCEDEREEAGLSAEHARHRVADALAQPALRRGAKD